MYKIPDVKENSMNRWRLSVSAALAFCVIVPLVSCGNFFTDSLGKDFARDPGTITVSSSNVKELLKEAKGDTEASRGILNKIAEKLEDNPDPDPVLQVAAITAANQASGLGMLVLENVDTLTGALSGGDDGRLGSDDANVIQNLLIAIEKGAEKNKIPEVADSIAKAVPVKDTPEGPKFDADLDIPTSQLLLLATTMLIAESEKAQTDTNNYIKKWTSGQKSLNATNTETWDPTERFLGAVVNELAGRSDLGGDFSNLLKTQQ
jgi:hypothetical protein